MAKNAVLTALQLDPWDLARMNEPVARDLDLKNKPHDRDAWITALATIAERHLAGWPTRDKPDEAALAASRAAALALGAKN